MGEKRTVVVKGGVGNLYEVSESDGTYYVYKGSSYGRSSIGKTRSLDGALSLIRSHSAREIERIG